MIDIELLDKEIRDMGIKRIVLAQKCGISRQTFDKKMANPELFSRTEVENLAGALRIPVGSEEFTRIFFAPDVEEKCKQGGEE